MQLYRSVVLSVAVLGATTATTHAHEKGFEMSANLGSATHPNDTLLRPPSGPTLSGRTDGSVASWSAALAYHFNRNIAMSLGYVRFGDIESTLSDATGATDTRAYSAFSAKGVTLDMIGKFPLGNWEPFVRAGLLFSSTELRYNGSAAGNAFADRIDGDTLDTFVGAGVGYKLSDQWTIKLEATYQKVGDPVTGRSSYKGSYLGLGWKF